MTYRLPIHLRRASVSSAQSRPRLMQRGGRNLGLRYQQLESFVRSTTRKAALLETIDSSRLVEQHSSLSVINESRVLYEKVEMFHGLVVPQEPKPPESDGEFFTHSFALSLTLRRLVPECCMSGCAICVYDLYEDTLLTYQASLASLRTQLKSMGIPQSEWPSRVKPSLNSQVVQRPSNTSLDAFEAMEKALKVKQQGRVEGGS